MPEESWLLLHGTPLTPAVWDEVAQRVVAHGSVSCPSAALTGGATDSVGALAQRVLDGTSASQLHLVGHSFGGQVALEAALLAPQRVHSMTMICSRASPFPAFAATAHSLERGEPMDAEATLGRWFREEELAAGGSVVQYARRCLINPPRDQWARALRSISEYDRLDRVPLLDIPVTLIAAEHDGVSTPEAMGDLGRRLPRSWLHVWPGAKHMTPFTDPDALADLILEAARR